jgi:hypothetical protein
MGWDNSGRRVLAYILVFIKSGEYRIQVLLGPKNVETEKRTLIAQVLALKFFIKTSYFFTS